MSSSRRRVIVITGSNRGLGRGVVEQLLCRRQHCSDEFHLILTARNEKALKLVVDQMIKKSSSNFTLETFGLDVSSPSSINAFIAYLTRQRLFIDVLYNNAGVVNKELEDYSLKTKPNKDNLQWTFDTNYFGTIQLTTSMLSMLSQDAKVLQISSNLGQLIFQGSKGREFLSNPNLTLAELNSAAHKYIQNSPQNDESVFSNAGYHTSKAFLNAYVRQIAPKILKPEQSMYAIHPGWVKTDVLMGGDKAEETIEEACSHLCDLITKLPYGRNPLSFQFLYRMNPIPF